MSFPVNRRKFLKGAAGAAMASASTLPLVVPRRARALSGGSPPWAVTFDGNTYLTTQGEVANMPTSSPYGLLSYWYNNLATMGQPILLQNILDQWYDNTVWIVMNQFSGNGSNQALGKLQLDFAPDANYDQVMEMMTDDILPVDGNWHHVIAAWDTNGGQVLGSVDGVPVAFSDQRGVSYGLPFAPSYGFPWQIGGSVADGWGVYFSGDLAEFFLLIPGNFIDPTDPTVMARFRDPNTGLPVRIGSTGWDVFADLGLVPQIWLSGPASLFPQNLAAGTWTWPATYTDTTPSSAFVTAAGGLMTAATDPWGNSTS